MINPTVEQLSKIVTKIREAIDATNSAAKEIAAGNLIFSHREQVQPARNEQHDGTAGRHRQRKRRKR
jgi:hypothetical protein